MAKPMTAFTTDLQHSGMIAKDLDETIKFYREVMGFELAGLFMNGENRCAFLRYGHLTIETWEGDPAPMTTGAINHWVISFFYCMFVNIHGNITIMYGIVTFMFSTQYDFNSG